MKKIFVVLFLLTLFVSCEKVYIPPPETVWRNENVVVVCNHTDFMVSSHVEIRHDELNTSRPLYGWDYQVYLQYDYLKEHPIQEGVVGTYNLIDY